MKTLFQSRLMTMHLVLASVAIMYGSPGSAQAPDRVRYAELPDWTVTTYRAAESKALLRCSAERHYDNGLTLTVAKNAAGKYVLGFTSSEWPYEDRSTHPVSMRIDSGDETLLPGRARLLPTGPIVFVDVQNHRIVIPAISAGNRLHVSSGKIDLEFGLAGSAAALVSLDLCHRDASTKP
jgi:hypothetical protein